MISQTRLSKPCCRDRTTPSILSALLAAAMPALGAGAPPESAHEFAREALRSKSRGEPVRVSPILDWRRKRLMRQAANREQAALPSAEAEPGEALVTITARDVEALQPRLTALGVEILCADGARHFIEARIPLSRLDDLEALGEHGLMGIRPIVPPINHAGSVTSQGDFVHEADRVRAALPAGFDGNGVRVGILADSFDVSGDGSASADIASGDLPGGGVTVLDEGAGGIDAGRAMCQLVHDLAPGASLVFNSRGSSPGVCADRIRALADPAEGNATVIADDIEFLEEPKFQDGVIAEAVDEVVTTRDVNYFSAAGNSGRSGYESSTVNFVPDSALDDILGETYTLGRNLDYYDFDPGPGIDLRQEVTIPAGGRFIPNLQWDDPFYTTSGVDTELDYYLLDSSDTIVSVAADDNIALQVPSETPVFWNEDLNPPGLGTGFINQTGSTQVYSVVIALFDGPPPGRLKYVNFGDYTLSADPPLDAPTVNPHAAAGGARAVGAAAYFDQDTVRPYSSQGPTTILFEPDGTPMASPEVRNTPGLVAVDGTDTTFFPALPLIQTDIDNNGYPNFGGTSAAAPHAAAVAALVRQANPSFTAAQVYDALESTAIDLGAPGRDVTAGHGLINAWDAVFGAPTPAIPDVADDFEDGDLPPAFETRSTGRGRIVTSDANGPLGSRHVVLDASYPKTGSNGRNELVLHLDLQDAVRVGLSFAQREFDDADHPMPDLPDGSVDFSGSTNADGVALSVDGGHDWFTLVSLTGANSTSTYQTHTFDLNAFALANGIALGSDVRIKFQQYGLLPAPDDGIAFDDITVTSVFEPVVSTASDFAAGSLRAVMAEASAGATITFEPALDGLTLTLGGSELMPDKDLTVDASALPDGFNIDAGGLSRVFHVPSATEFTIERVSMRRGHAAGEGGAVRNDGTLTVKDASLTGSFAVEGAALWNSGAATLENCTVAGNLASWSGGGIASVGTATLRHVTVSDNHAWFFDGGGLWSAGTLALENSIVAGNLATTDPDLAGSPPQLMGGNLTSGDPRLAPLDAFGGAAPVMPPLPGSPAIEGAVPLAATPAADQRGGVRPAGPLPDLGAVEAFPFSTVPLVDTDLDGIDDRLEPAYGLVVGVDDRASDQDGDGSPDHEELASMTDPEDPGDFFRILSFATAPDYHPVTNPSFVLRFASFPGLTYEIRESADASSFQLLLAPFPADDFETARELEPTPGHTLFRALRK